MINLTRTFLPDIIKHRGKEYKVDMKLTARYTDKKPFNTKGCILLKVTNPRLAGKVDLHGKSYQPTEWIYTEKPAT